MHPFHARNLPWSASENGAARGTADESERCAVDMRILPNTTGLIQARQSATRIVAGRSNHFSTVAMLGHTVLYQWPNKRVAQRLLMLSQTPTQTGRFCDLQTAANNPRVAK